MDLSTAVAPTVIAVDIAKRCAAERCFHPGADYVVAKPGGVQWHEIADGRDNNLIDERGVGGPNHNLGAAGEWLWSGFTRRRTPKMKSMG
jgi:hypothetical protein